MLPPVPVMMQTFPASRPATSVAALSRRAERRRPVQSRVHARRLAAAQVNRRHRILVIPLRLAV